MLNQQKTNSQSSINPNILPLLTQIINKNQISFDLPAQLEDRIDSF